jgi:hypothetical protein
MNQIISISLFVWEFLLQPIPIVAAIACCSGVVVLVDFMVANRLKAFNAANENKIFREANAAVELAFGGNRGRLLRQFDNLTMFQSNENYYKWVEMIEAHSKKLRVEFDALVDSRAATAKTRNEDSARLTRDDNNMAETLSKVSAEFDSLRNKISRWVKELEQYSTEQEDVVIPAWWLHKLAAEFAELEQADPRKKAIEKKENSDDGGDGDDDGSGSTVYEPKTNPK